MDSRKLQNVLLLAIVILLTMIVMKGSIKEKSELFSIASANAQIGKSHEVPLELSAIPVEWGDLVTGYIHKESLFLVFQNTKKEILIYRAGKNDNQTVIADQGPATLAEVSVFPRK